MEKTYYFAAFVPEPEGGYFILIPDVPDAFTEANSLAEGMEMAEDVLKLLLRGLIAAGRQAPSPSPIERVKALTAAHLREIGHETAGEILYQLLPSPNLDMAPVRVSISLPKAVLEEIDAKADAGGFTRSGFLAKAAREYQL